MQPSDPYTQEKAMMDCSIDWAPVRHRRLQIFGSRKVQEIFEFTGTETTSPLHSGVINRDVPHGVGWLAPNLSFINLPLIEDQERCRENTVQRHL